MKEHEKEFVETSQKLQDEAKSILKENNYSEKKIDEVLESIKPNIPIIE